MRRTGGPLPRLVNATRLSRHSKPPCSPPIRLVSSSTPLRANALYAAATPSNAPPDKRIFRQGASRSWLSITPHLFDKKQPQKKRGYLESNRALESTHGGGKNYRLDRFLARPRARPLERDAPRERLLAPPRAADLRPPDLRAPGLRPPDCRPDDLRPDDLRPPALRTDDFRVPPFLPPAERPALRPADAFFRLDFLLPEREALVAAFLLDPAADRP